MHSIWVRTDADLQQYPHVFFASSDIWDASVLDHGVTPALLEEIHQEADDSLLNSMFDEFGDLHQQVVQHLNVFWDSIPIESGDHTFHADLLQTNTAEEDWNLSGLILDGNLNKIYKINTRLPEGLEVLSLKKHFKSRNAVFNIPRRNDPVTQLPSMMEVPWHISFLERTL